MEPSLLSRFQGALVGGAAAAALLLPRSGAVTESAKEAVEPIADASVMEAQQWLEQLPVLLQGYDQAAARSTWGRQVLLPQSQEATGVAGEGIAGEAIAHLFAHLLLSPVPQAAVRPIAAGSWTQSLWPLLEPVVLARPPLHQALQQFPCLLGEQPRQQGEKSGVSLTAAIATLSPWATQLTPWELGFCMAQFCLLTTPGQWALVLGRAQQWADRQGVAAAPVLAIAGAGVGAQVGLAGIPLPLRLQLGPTLAQRLQTATTSWQHWAGYYPVVQPVIQLGIQPEGNPGTRP